MARASMIIGALLVALGMGAYYGTSRASVTALIPAAFGVPILLLGILALPVADDVDAGLLFQLEVRLQMRAGDVFHRIIRAPASATRRNAHAIDQDDEKGPRPGIAGRGRRDGR